MTQPSSAIAVLKTSTGQSVGVVTFRQNNLNIPVTVEANVFGLTPNTIHGLHIHEYGDESNGCESLGPHFNPFKEQHGSVWLGENTPRHAGDMLNNISVDNHGNGALFFSDAQLSLIAEPYFNIIGRSVVLHEKSDDLGVGTCPESLETGCAGARIACGVIGWCKPT